VLIVMLLAAGIACWAYRSRRAGRAALPGLGLIAGMAVFVIGAWKNLTLEQYTTPLFLSAAMFAPYAFPPYSGPSWTRWLRRSMLAVAMLAACYPFLGIARDFRYTPWNVRSEVSTALRAGRLLMQPPCLKTLQFYDSCLKLIPEDERVVAVWPYHPLFRKDLTWVTNDDRPSFTEFMAADDPAQQAVAPESFRRAMEEHPPAYIVVSRLECNYPPGWTWECREFLRRHKSEYYSFSVDGGDTRIAVRRDLVPDRAAAADRFDNAFDIVYWEAPALLDAAKASDATGQTDDAIAAYRMALEVDPDNAAAHNGLGKALCKVGQKEEAIVHLHRALDICKDSERLRFHIDLADVLAEQSRRDEALTHLREALDIAAADNDDAMVKKIRARIKSLQDASTETKP